MHSETHHKSYCRDYSVFKWVWDYSPGPAGLVSWESGRSETCKQTLISLNNIKKSNVIIIITGFYLPRGKVRPADKLQLKAATILPLLDSPDPSKIQ